MSTPRCGKRKFRDEIAAKIALADIRRRDSSRRGKQEQRAYYHAECHAWHLTSKKIRGGRNT